MSDKFDNIAVKRVAPENVMAPLCPNGQLYTVKSGDTLFFLAKRYNIPLQSLINANPQIVDPNTIYPGQVICLPIAGPGPGPGVPCPGGQMYTVVKGDSMYEIAKRSGVTLDALIRANPQIVNPSEIFPGQEVCIPSPLPGPIPMPLPVPLPPPCPNGMLYTVKSGDSLYLIAQANNISMAAIIAANPQISDPNKIMPGQVICVPKMMEMPTPPVTINPVVPVPPMPVMPMPFPIPPAISPITMPSPAPPAISPITMPCPAPPVTLPSPVLPSPSIPCPPGMVQSPVYIIIPWDECPHRPKKRKKHHHHHDKECCH